MIETQAEFKQQLDETIEKFLKSPKLYVNLQIGMIFQNFAEFVPETMNNMINKAEPGHIYRIGEYKGLGIYINPNLPYEHTKIDFQNEDVYSVQKRFDIINSLI